MMSQEGDNLLSAAPWPIEQPHELEQKKFTITITITISKPSPSILTSAPQSHSIYPPSFTPPCPCPWPWPWPPFPLLPPALEPAEAFAFLSPALCALAAKPPLLISLPPVACCETVLVSAAHHTEVKGCFLWALGGRTWTYLSGLDALGIGFGCLVGRHFSILLGGSLECVGIGIGWR